MADVLLSAPVTAVLLAVTCLVSALAFRRTGLAERLMIDIAAIRLRGEYDRLIASGFVHGDPGHLLFNMLTLLFIGPYVEARIGSLAFAAAYGACLLSGSLLTLLENAGRSDYRALGASGAVSGVTILFALFDPFAILFVLFIPMPAIVFAAGYIAWSAYASGRVQDGIGHAAHLGGALGGLALACLFWPDTVRSLPEQVLGVLGG